MNLRNSHFNKNNTHASFSAVTMQLSNSADAAKTKKLNFKLPFIIGI